MKDWTNVRMTRRTRTRLKEFLKSQVALQEQGRIVLPESGSPGGGDPSVDWIVNHLLDRVMKHRKRGKKQRDRKRGFAYEELLGDQAGQQLGDQAANPKEN